MRLRFTTRTSDSPWIDSVWTCSSDHVTEMTSIAAVRWGLVFWSQDGTAHAGITGPETTTATAPVPEGATFTGIEFALGTTLRAIPALTLVNGGIALPDTTRRGFRLDGHRWETPDPDDAEALVERLVRTETVVRDPLVTETLRGGRSTASPRTIERRFRTTTGLTQGTIRQVERARMATELLAAGNPVADVVTGLGYFDEPHLARALRRYIGRTTTQLRHGDSRAIAMDLDQAPTR